MPSPLDQVLAEFDQVLVDEVIFAYFQVTNIIMSNLLLKREGVREVRLSTKEGGKGGDHRYVYCQFEVSPGRNKQRGGT